MRGMELWRPDWAQLMGEQVNPNAAELVLITHETARLALSALIEQNKREAYHNYMAAQEELRVIIDGGHYAKAS